VNIFVEKVFLLGQSRTMEISLGLGLSHNHLILHLLNLIMMVSQQDRNVQKIVGQVITLLKKQVKHSKLFGITLMELEITGPICGLMLLNVSKTKLRSSGLSL